MVDVSSTVQCKVRTAGTKGTARKLRTTGWVPVAVYGPGSEPVNLAVEAHTFLLQRHTFGSSHIYDVAVEGGKGFKALIKDVQRDPVTSNLLHVDLYAVDMKKPIRVDVKVVLTGKAAGEKDGGLVSQVLRNIELLCLPANVPSKIEVDVTEMKLGDTLHTSDLKLPEGVKLTALHDQAIVSVMAPEAEEKPATPAEGEVAATGEAAAAEAAPAAEAK